MRYSINRTLKFGVSPLIVYLIFFCIYTHPLIKQFSTHYFTDQWDGLQSVWNIWWVNKSLIQLHQNPWYTSYLYYPHGTWLVGHTLNPFNGILAVFLLNFLSLLQSFNTILIFSFVATGCTAFILAYYISGSYLGSLVAGYIFTFSSFHFAHAQGHMQLVAMEWIPLFVFCWYRFITRPNIRAAFGSAICLFAVILCDYYYFLYCVMTASIILLWHAVKNRDFLFFIKKDYKIPIMVFGSVSFVTSGILLVSFLILNLKDPLIGAHNPKEFSLDVFALFIPGGHWRFADLTRVFWSKLPGNIHESSVYIGISVWIIILYVFFNKRKIRNNVMLWYLILIFFSVLALGPVLQLWGQEISDIVLPYRLFEKIFPLLKLSGVPVRMTVMVLLSASILSAVGINILIRGSKGNRLLVILLLITLFFEYLPQPIPANRIPTPEHIRVLKSQPGTNGVIDLYSSIAHALYYQTIHEKPMAFGYISRRPTSVIKKSEQVSSYIDQKDYDQLCKKYNIRYMILPSNNGTGKNDSLQVIYQDHKVKIVDLGAETSCKISYKK